MNLLYCVLGLLDPHNSSHAHKGTVTRKVTPQCGFLKLFLLIPLGTIPLYFHFRIARESCREKGDFKFLIQISLCGFINR